MSVEHIAGISILIVVSFVLLMLTWNIKRLVDCLESQTRYKLMTVSELNRVTWLSRALIPIGTFAVALLGYVFALLL